MIQITGETEIFFYGPAIDMRKSIDGLNILLSESLAVSPQSGSLYIFHNKLGNKVKIIYWDKNGFILHYKRLERGHFKIPKLLDGKIAITEDQLSWLLAGLDFVLMDRFSELNYENYY